MVTAEHKTINISISIPINLLEETDRCVREALSRDGRASRSDYICTAIREKMFRDKERA